MAIVNGGVSSMPQCVQQFDTSALTDRPAIESYLASLTIEEVALDESLEQLIQSRDKLSTHLKSLISLKDVLCGMQAESYHAAREVRAVAETAERVGGKVRVLDEEQSKVKGCMEFVQAVQNLKSSITSLDQAMQKQDWEAATRHMQRASTIDTMVVTSSFAEAVVPTSALPLAPPQTLATIRESLLQTFLSEFRSATALNDTNNVNRFFKLFPMIGEDAAGLEVYAEWVSGVVRAKSASLSVKSQSPTHYSALLTVLFESIALIVSQHQPVVEKYYGRGQMHAVVQKLLSESDHLGFAIMQNWEEERQIVRKIALVQAFSFISLIGTKSRSNKVDSGPTVVEDDRVDPRDIDAILAELSLMSSRWQLLRRFLYGRLKESDEDVQLESVVAHKLNVESERESRKTIVMELPSNSGEADLVMVESSSLGLSIVRQMASVFQPLEIWYLRSSIDKAHSMDELDLGVSPPLSSSLDDIFYIFKKSLHRLVSTGSSGVVVSTCKELKSVLERDVGEIWKGKVDMAFKDLAAGPNKARDEERDRREHVARTTVNIYLNNIDTAATYTMRLVDEIVNGESLQQAFFLPGELERAHFALLSLRAVEDRFRQVLKSGLDHVFNQLVRPRLRSIIADIYKDVSYVLEEDSYAEAEYRDDVRKRFIDAWETLLNGYRETLTPSSYDIFFATVVSVLVRPWEGTLRGMRFTELGALRLDRDIRSILSYLSAQSAYSSGSLRESFSRLQQIAAVLTLESLDEADEVLSATGNRLTEGEVKAIWAMRV